MSTEAVAASSTSLLLTDSDGDISLLEILDHVLNSGVVIHGSLVISLAGVDLVYVGLNVVLTSVETALRNIDRDGAGTAASSSRRDS
jgi:gas vesicle structural protein